MTIVERSSRSLFCAVLFLSMFFVSCGFKIPPAPTLTSHQTLDDSEEKVFLEELRAYTERVRAFRGKFDVSIESSFGSNSLTQVLVFARPSKLRLEYFVTNLNTLTALLIANGGSLHAVDPIRNRVYRGPAKEEVVEKLLSVPLSPEALMLWSVGRFSLPTDDENPSLIVYRKKDEFAVEYTKENARTILAVLKRTSEDFGAFVLQRFEIRAQDESRLLVTDYAYEPLESLPESEVKTPRVPKDITFWLPKKKLTGTLALGKHEVNPSFDEKSKKLFLGRTMGGAKVYYLDESSSSLDVEPFL